MRCYTCDYQMKSSLKKYIGFLAVRVKACLKNKYRKYPKLVSFNFGIFWTRSML